MTHPAHCHNASHIDTLSVHGLKPDHTDTLPVHGHNASHIDTLPVSAQNVSSTYASSTATTLVSTTRFHRHNAGLNDKLPRAQR